MLPNDPLLQVLHFADYKTLVITKFSGASFLRVATKFAAELACRRRFQVSIGSYITYTDLTTGVQHMIMCRADDPTSLAGACRELAEVIGPHAVANLTFGLHTWNVPGIDAIFEAAPPLKYAEDVELRSPPGSTVKVNTEAFMHNFSGMKSLRLKCNYDVFRQYSWAFLREESARELLRVGVGAEHEPGSMNENPAAEELVRYCTTLRRQEEALELDFSESKPFRSAFGRRVIELLTNSWCRLNVRMSWLQDGELVFRECDYNRKVRVDDTTKRFASDKSGIVVEVKKSPQSPLAMQLTIYNAAEVPRKKPRRSCDIMTPLRLIE